MDFESSSGAWPTLGWAPPSSWRTIPGQTSLEEQDFFRRSSAEAAELGGLVGPPRAPEEHSQPEKPWEFSEERSKVLALGRKQLQAPGAATGKGQGSCPTSIVPSHLCPIPIPPPQSQTKFPGCRTQQSSEWWSRSAEFHGEARSVSGEGWGAMLSISLTLIPLGAQEWGWNGAGTGLEWDWNREETPPSMRPWK